MSGKPGADAVQNGGRIRSVDFLKGFAVAPALVAAEACGRLMGRIRSRETNLQN